VVADIFVAVFMIAFGLFRLAEAHRVWRDPRLAGQPGADDILVARFFGKRVARGARRAVIAQVCVLLSVAFLMVTLVLAALLAGSAASTVRGTGGLVGVAGVLYGTVTGLMIMFLNRPKFMVPPPLRSEAGILTQRPRN
jgi:hypothetical protein